MIRGLEGSEDAGVFVISEDTALVQTVDVLTPIVDDPFLFGQIAAVNAFSDVYAMGGTPLTAMNIVCFPVQQLGVESLRRVIEGGLEVIREAGAVLIGGHSLKAEEPKYGLAITGTVDPRRMMTNDALKTGDRIVLTKPIGTGVISSASKQGLASVECVEAMVDSMSTLNREASARAMAAEIRAASDVTGFGLAGHLVEMARASRCHLVLRSSAVPLLPSAREHAEAGRFPGGSRANQKFFSAWTSVDNGVREPIVGLMFDAQTSGGLILGAEESVAHQLVEELRHEGHDAAVVGEVVDDDESGAVRISS